MLLKNRIQQAMSNINILKKLEIIEDNARRLLEDTAALKEELSGGSDSSISKSVFTLSQQQSIINKRRATAFNSKGN